MLRLRTLSLADIEPGPSRDSGNTASAGGISATEPIVRYFVSNFNALHGRKFAQSIAAAEAGRLISGQSFL